jgi:hypothetical protein
MIAYDYMKPQDRYGELEKANVTVELHRMDGLDRDVDIREKDGMVYLAPIDGRENAIMEYIHEHPHSFRKESSSVSMQFHNSPTSYRQIAHPSLRLTWHKAESRWDAHFDKWCPTLRDPFTIAAHCLFEVTPHIIFHTRIDQQEISRQLLASAMAGGAHANPF